MRIWISLIFISVFSGIVFAEDFSPASLLQESDRSRGAVNPQEGLTWTIALETTDSDAPQKITYNVKIKGNDALCEATDPPRSKGELTLFNDRNLWFYKPGLKKPISISGRQKLMGQAANGDIASTNYYRDYDGVFVKEENVGNTPAILLELKAKAKNVTYDKIRYWISKDKKLGIKAEFLTVSGEVFKVAELAYDNQLTAQGKNFPFVSKVIIFDPKKPTEKTTLTYSSPKIENHADSMFNVNNLVR